MIGSTVAPGPSSGDARPDGWRRRGQGHQTARVPPISDTRCGRQIVRSATGRDSGAVIHHQPLLRQRPRHTPPATSPTRPSRPPLTRRPASAPVRPTSHFSDSAEPVSQNLLLWMGNDIQMKIIFHSHLHFSRVIFHCQIGNP